MIESAKRGILIFYDYFYPAYKAGGPIQSLTNLILALKDDYKIAVVTSNHDLNDDKILTGIESDTWSSKKLPYSDAIIDVYYSSPGKLTMDAVKGIVAHIKPSAVYLNGMFSYRFVLLPLLSVKGAAIFICPRGMLQQGALSGKSFKKKIYLSLLTISGLVKQVTWHATNEEESNDIKKQFGKNANTIIAANIPKKPIDNIIYPFKEPQQLNLVYLSLISEKKNLLLLINIFSKLSENISLDIYGPVKDKIYWEKCLAAIKLTNRKIVYKGDVVPEKVQETFSQYHASILLTKGENFGHALYESLSSGRPVITSYFTIWKDLEIKKAGLNVDIFNEEDMIQAINKFYNMDQNSYNIYCNGAFALANEYYRTSADISNYKKLFIKLLCY